VATRSPSFVLDSALRQRLAWSLAAFAVSSLIAIGTLVPLALRTVDAARLAPEIRNRWDGTVDEARKTTTATRIADLASLQQVNTIKSMLLVAAVVVQVVAVLLLAWSVTGLLGTATH
jgi:NAD+--asparagine ADP-ribosyltransferase